jgi:hypothetical protein
VVVSDFAGALSGRAGLPGDAQGLNGPFEPLSGDVFVQPGRFILGSGQLPRFIGQLLPQSYQPSVRRSGVRIAGRCRHRPVALPLAAVHPGSMTILRSHLRSGPAQAPGCR